MAKRIEDYILEADKTEGKKQLRPIFKRKRGNEVLTREQVKAIKQGRKALRKDLKKKGVKNRQDFEVIATSQGLYFDKKGLLALFWWTKGCGLWMLLGAAAALLGVLTLLSWVTELRGHFTISLSEEMFREGFVISETADFKNPTTYLFATPAEDVPCISINDIPVNVDEFEGAHNEKYFAYTFFVRNEGESMVDYTWDMMLNSESKSLSDAVWAMIFEDGRMQFYAEPNAEGQAEALPAFGDDTRGYLNPKMLSLSARPEEQFQLIRQRGDVGYYRLVPHSFLTESHVAGGYQEQVAPMDVHKYTIVIWLEGDDPDCTNEMIGGHVGMEFNIELTNVYGSEG